MEFQRAEPAARHDFAISFQRDAFALQLELFDQAGDVKRGWKGARLAVDDECDHFKMRNGFCTMNVSTRV